MENNTILWRDDKEDIQLVWRAPYYCLEYKGVCLSNKRTLIGNDILIHLSRKLQILIKKSNKEAENALLTYTFLRDKHQSYNRVCRNISNQIGMHV